MLDAPNLVTSNTKRHSLTFLLAANSNLMAWSSIKTVLLIVPRASVRLNRSDDKETCPFDRRRSASCSVGLRLSLKTLDGQWIDFFVSGHRKTIWLDRKLTTTLIQIGVNKPIDIVDEAIIGPNTKRNWEVGLRYLNILVLIMYVSLEYVMHGDEV